MALTEYLFWVTLLFGCINLQPKKILIVVLSIFFGSLLLVTNIFEFEGFAKYIVRLAALCIFGALAIKFNVFGLVLLFLCLLISSLLVILNKNHYFIHVILLFIPVAVIILKKMQKIVDYENNLIKWIAFMPLLGISAAIPFGLLISKVPLY